MESVYQKRMYFQKYIAFGLLVYFQIFFLHSFWVRTAEHEQQNKYRYFEQRLNTLELRLSNQQRQTQREKHYGDGTVFTDNDVDQEWDHSGEYPGFTDIRSINVRVKIVRVYSYFVFISSVVQAGK